MLKGLDDIPWASLKHAYGSAKDVPDQIRALLHKDVTVRDKYWNRLYSNIYHQSSRYEATPYTVPFFYELIFREETFEKEKIIYFLAAISYGFSENYLPVGFDKIGYGVTFSNESLIWSPQFKRYYQGQFCMSGIELDCYKAVEKGIPKLWEIFDKQNKVVQSAIIYLSAWFSEYSDLSLGKMQKHLKTTTEESQVLMTLYAINHLALSARKTIDSTVTSPFYDHNSKKIRIAAALATVQEFLSEKVVDIILQNMKVENAREKYFHFYGGFLPGYVALFLAQFGDSSRPKISLWLKEQLAKKDLWYSTDFCRALLYFLSKPKSQLLSTVNPYSLDSTDIFIINTIDKIKLEKSKEHADYSFLSLLEEFGID